MVPQSSRASSTKAGDQKTSLVGPRCETLWISICVWQTVSSTNVLRSQARTVYSRQSHRRSAKQKLRMRNDEKLILVYLSRARQTGAPCKATKQGQARAAAPTTTAEINQTRSLFRHTHRSRVTSRQDQPWSVLLEKFGRSDRGVTFETLPSQDQVQQQQ